jgi:hypothetical protein
VAASSWKAVNFSIWFPRRDLAQETCELDERSRRDAIGGNFAREGAKS